METIVVATDYSKAGENAVKYAASLAKDLGTELIIFNTFNIPVPTSHVPSYLPNMDDLIEENRERLEKLCLETSKKYHVEASAFSSHGFTVDELKKVAQKKEADLIVMGMKGEKAISRKLFGSIATTIIREGRFPVLIVPENVSFRPVKKILFACDSRKLTLSTNLNILIEMAIAFNAKIQILQVVKEKEVAMSGGKEEELLPHFNLENIFLGVRHSYHLVEGDDIIEGIEKGINDNHSGLLVMAPHKPSFWQNLFSASHTRKMAFRTHIPLLSLPNSFT